jgi:hypothetical protein
VAFVKDHFIQVRVSAEVLDPHDGQRKLTNVFHYTFSTKVRSKGERFPRKKASPFYITGVCCGFE